MTEELKNCPFCGCKATFVKHSAGMPGTMGHDRWDAVACKHCRATVGACDRRFREKDDAAAAWNLRVPDARDARIAELEAARIAYASEFPLNADGDYDVGNIHANIRKLKAELVALKAPTTNSGSLPEMKQVNDLPATPWYPDDSGEWVEVPEDLIEMPARLSPRTVVAVLTENERELHSYIRTEGEAGDWAWCAIPNLGHRIVAYKVVKA